MCVCVFFYLFFSENILVHLLFEVLGIYVEPSILGHGGSYYNGDTACQWRGEYIIYHLLDVLSAFMRDFVQYNTFLLETFCILLPVATDSKT